MSKQEQSGIEEPSAIELAVMKALADGHTGAEIAADLQLTLATVESHKAAGMQKLNVRSRVELVRVAARSQWF